MLAILLRVLFVLALPVVYAQGDGVAAAPFGQAVTAPTRDLAAGEVLRAILTDPDYWDDAWSRRYEGKLYDEIRFVEIERGYVPMITGEGGRDLPNQVVEDAVFVHFDELPRHIGLVKRMAFLDRGHDPLVGHDYADAYLLFDASFFYIRFHYRLYRARDESGRRVLWFEKLTPDMPGPERWKRYGKRRSDLEAALSLRGAPFGAILEPEELFGVFLVEPGRVHASRVTFVARLAFDKEASWLAGYASQLPWVLRVALAKAFEAAVAICVEKVAEGARSTPHR